MDSSTYKYVCSTRTEVTSTLSRHKYDLSIFTVSILRTKQQWVTSGQQPHRNDVVALMVMVIVGSCFGNVFGVFVFENLLIPSRFHNLLFLCSETITSHSYIYYSVVPLWIYRMFCSSESAEMVFEGSHNKQYNSLGHFVMSRPRWRLNDLKSSFHHLTFEHLSSWPNTHVNINIVYPNEYASHMIHISFCANSSSVTSHDIICFVSTITIIIHSIRCF